MERLHEVQINPKSVAGFGRLLGPEAVEGVQELASRIRRSLDGHVIWNVNSTAAGGGVAELLRSLLAYTRGLGVDTRWLVIKGSPRFFRITKRLHNALHGDAGDGSDLGGAEREIFERTAAENAAEVCALVRPRDVVILHDPQTAGLLPHLVQHGAIVIWRCHVGHDEPTAEGDRAWSFLGPYLESAHAFVFSRFAYVPDLFDHMRCVIIAPSIDPFSPKNQELDEASVRAILVQAGLVGGPAGDGRPMYTREDGTSSLVERRADLRHNQPPPGWDTPLVVQISRWDRLKDPLGVLEGFDRFAADAAGAELVLAGPDVKAVADDPEGAEVFDQVVQHWGSMNEARRRRVHLASLPMDDVEENAAIVNALQRHAAVVVQKSVREGFGLTVTEAMWKARPVVASAVGGIQDQIEHGVSGLLLRDPSDLDGFVSALKQVLSRPELARSLAEHARERARQHYLGLRSLTLYAGLIERLG